MEAGKKAAMSEKALRYTAFTWMALIGLFGCLFVIGETFDDPGGWQAVVMVASWLVPLVALAWFALRRPAASEPVLVVATALVAAFSLTDAAIGIIPRDSWGPVAAIGVFAVGLALAFLGLHRPSRAGVLLVALAAAQFVAVVLERDGSGAPRLSLGGSSGVVVVPLLLGGVLFLLAGRASRPTSAHRSRHLAARG
jgi:hypothetical protein